MIRLNIHEAKTHLSRYLPNLEAGETIVLCKRNVPIAEIRPLAARRKAPRETGFMRGRFVVSDAFFAPLPADLLGRFEGRTDSEP
jgi:antitoxin (DNA-binding transcriptional repressor) of toxin-antitoxin stability system